MKPLLIFIGLLISFHNWAQRSIITIPLEKRVFKVNFLSPGVEYEQRLSAKWTLNLRAALAPRLAYSYSEDVGNTWHVALIPVADAQIRYYYKLEGRKSTSGTTFGNSGNFLALHSEFSGQSLWHSDFPQPAYSTIAAVWGMQRTYSSGLNLSLYAGPGVQVGQGRKPQFVPVIGLRVGWVFKNRQRDEEARVKEFEKRFAHHAAERHSQLSNFHKLSQEKPKYSQESMVLR